MEKPDPVLVLAAGSLGDSLLTLPALRTLQSRALVTLAGTAPYLSLGAKLMGVDRVIPLDPLLQILLSSSPRDAQKEFWIQFKEIFVFFKEPDELIRKNLASLSPAQVHFPSKPFAEFLEETRWAADYWLETVFQCPLAPDSPFRLARLHMGEKLKERGKQILSSLNISFPLVIHPGSGSESKNAPLSFFKDAAERAVRESQKQVLVVWGEAEEKNRTALQAAFAGLKDTVILDKILSLPDLAAVLSQSAAYLGNDSGVTQLASACGLKTFAVFKSTDSRVWGPQTNAFILNGMKDHLSRP